MQLTADGCAARREQLISRVTCDLIVVANPRHIQYLSGLYVKPQALSGWGLNFLLIDTATGKSRLLVHNFIAGEARQAHVDDVDVWTWYDVAKNPGVELFGRAVQELNIRLSAYAGKHIGMEAGWLPFGAAVTQSEDIAGTLRDMRRRKYTDELALIREAVRVNEAGHRAARAALQPGATELDVYSAIEAAMVKEAGHAVLLMGDFSSGERAEHGGGPATARVLQIGDLMIFDLFPIVNGYRADFTATGVVGGQLSAQQRALETALNMALQAGEGQLKPGNRASVVYQAVYDALDEHGFASGFTHHAGHGLGLDHPEAPFFVPNSEETLVTGDVVTLEPGSYGKGYGARIERNYVITASGFEVLSRHSTMFT